MGSFLHFCLLFDLLCLSSVYDINSNRLAHKDANILDSVAVARKRVTISSRATAANLKKRTGGDVVDTRVRPYNVRRLSNSSDSTNSEWVDAKNTGKYKSYQCCFCQKEFSSRHLLGKHVKNNCLSNPDAKCNTDFGNNPYVCQDCGRRFKLRKMLTFHERRECKMYVTCTVCNKKLVGANVTAKHIQRCKRKVFPHKKEPIEIVLDSPSKNEKSFISQRISSSDEVSE